MRQFTNKLLVMAASIATFTVPFLAFSAQEFTIKYIFGRAGAMLSATLELLVLVAFVVFVWGVIKYVMAQGDENKLKEGKQVMVYGIIGLTVIVALWGILALIVFTIFGELPVDPFEFVVPPLISP